MICNSKSLDHSTQKSIDLRSLFLFHLFFKNTFWIFFNYPEKNIKNARQCADQDFLDWPTKWWWIFLLSNVKSRKKCQTLLGACFAIGTEYVALLLTSSKYSIQSCFLIFCKFFSICSFRCGTISAVIEFGSCNWLQIINFFFQSLNIMFSSRKVLYFPVIYEQIGIWINHKFCEKFRS